MLGRGPISVRTRSHHRQERSKKILGNRNFMAELRVMHNLREGA